MDWFSRHVLSWRLSNTLDVRFCLEAVDEALRRSRPSIFNSDQGSQFTAATFTGRLESRGVAISMDGRGRAIDNIFIERSVADRQVRGGLSERLRQRWEAEESPRRLLSILLVRTHSPGARLSNAGASLRGGHWDFSLRGMRSQKRKQSPRFGVQRAPTQIDDRYRPTP